MVPTPEKGFDRAKITIKKLNTPKNNKYSSVHRFEMLPIFWGQDTVVNLVKLT